MNLSRHLAMQGRKYPDKEALIAAGGSRVTFKEWNEQANLWAARLRQAGIAAGDRVVLMMPNCVEFAVMYFAIMRSGAIVVPINARSTEEDVAYICSHSQASGIIVHELLWSGIARVADERAFSIALKTGTSSGKWSGMADWVDEADLLKAFSVDAELPGIEEDDEVSMLYTSGTTGRPKGVLFTHRNLLSVSTMIAIEFEINRQSRILHLMPLSHSAPLHLFFVTGVLVGAAQVLAPTFSPELLLGLTQQERITHFFGAPVAYLLTMKHPEFASYDLSSVRYWCYGGAPLSKEMASLMENGFGRDKLACVYGLTEAGPTGTCLRHRDHADKAGSIGQPVLFVELEIVDERGLPVTIGEPGEIRLRSDGTMKGYYRNPEATAEAMIDGWLYSGDIATQDEDGFLYLIDRKKDIIITGGVNVYPKEVELQLERHPAIQEVAVIGVPHPEWGETVKAFLVRKPGAEPADGAADWLEDIRAFLSGKVADYKLPRLAEAIDALPRNASGKILKSVLRDQSNLQGGKNDDKHPIANR
ncbi:MAG: class I adenylate-forming enzyme family protein [Clostridia bacterium]